MKILEKIIRNYFAAAGITINGYKPWDIQVHNPKLYYRVARHGSIGFGEAYMEGWWDCEALDELFFRVQYHRVDKKMPKILNSLFYFLKSSYKNMQTNVRAKKVVKKHYDLSNDLFKKILDKRMMYSCGYWETATNLNDAQEATLELICQKIKLEKGMTLLDLGCGWGGFAKYAAEKYGAKVTGITISEEQAAFCRQITKGLDVAIKVTDYRDLHEKFDRIVMIEVIEHIGYRNYRTLMEMLSENLNEDGICLLQTIGGNYDAKYTDPWIDKYIFPNGMLASASQLSKAWQGLFVLQDWHNFGPYYDSTLMAWLKNLEKNRDSIKADYDEAFCRMWCYYLSASAASFRSRKNHDWQIVLTKPLSLIPYVSIR
jgi:cyclopropane-fatty-acyl-phospholipid synthase